MCLAQGESVSLEVRRESPKLQVHLEFSEINLN